MSTNPRNRQQLLHDLSQLIPPTREPPTLRREDPLPPIPARRGYIERNNQPGASTGGGIASPLTEVTPSAREYWPGGSWSSDGLFVIPAVKKIVMRDAEGSPVEFYYAEP